MRVQDNKTPPDDRPRRDPDFKAALPASWVSRVECRTCAYEPLDQEATPRGRCPKCYATTWVRVVRMTSRHACGARWKTGKTWSSTRRPADRCLCRQG